ncbi:hypothetical protein, partial [Acinetobacter baumannii]|uniref:hypothetical protein n=1 Tax=Acinetobacter baumannii TaxID=470 RepID=UPI00148D7AD0
LCVWLGGFLVFFVLVVVGCWGLGGCVCGVFVFGFVGFLVVGWWGFFFVVVVFVWGFFGFFVFGVFFLFVFVVVGFCLVCCLGFVMIDLWSL